MESAITVKHKFNSQFVKPTLYALNVLFTCHFPTMFRHTTHAIIRESVVVILTVLKVSCTIGEWFSYALPHRCRNVLENWKCVTHLVHIKLVLQTNYHKMHGTFNVTTGLTILQMMF